MASTGARIQSGTGGTGVVRGRNRARAGRSAGTGQPRRDAARSLERDAIHDDAASPAPGSMPPSAMPPSLRPRRSRTRSSSPT